MSITSMESEVQQVLSVCPHADVDVIQKDLYLTRNVAETVNRLLDGIIKPTSEEKNNGFIAAASEEQQRTSNFKDYSANDSDDEDDDDYLPNIFSGSGKTVMSSRVSDEVQEVKSGVEKVGEGAIVDLTLGEDVEMSKSENHCNTFVERQHCGHTDEAGNSISVTKNVNVCDIRGIPQCRKETSEPSIDVSLRGKVHCKDKRDLLPLDSIDNEVLDWTQNGSSLSRVKKFGQSVDISSSDDSEEEGVSVTTKHSLISDAEGKHGRTYPQLSTTSNFGKDSHERLKSNFIKADTEIPSEVIQNSHCNWKQSSKGKMIDISSSDDSDDELPLWKRIQMKNQKDNKASSLKRFDVDNGIIKDSNRGCGGTVKGLASINNKVAMSKGDSQLSVVSSSVSHQVSSSVHGLSDDESQSVNSSESQLSDVSKGKKRKKRSPEEIHLSKQQALERRAEREREKKERDQKREEKRKEKERELEQRKALREAHKALRPEECMKRLTVCVDQSLLQESCGHLFLKKFQELACKVDIIPQKVEGTITWSRQQTELNLGEDIQLSKLDKSTEETDALLVMKMNEFVHLVHASTQDRLGNIADGETLNAHAHRCIQTLGGKSVTYLVQGAEQYFRNNKNRHQRNFRTAVLGAEADQTKNKKGKKRKDDDSLPVISRVQMEEALVSLQLQHGCNVHCCETPDALADFIGMFTKSVAEKPFKKERDKSTFSFHVNSEWAGGVRVSKDGIGMIKVWKQQLQQFRNVSPEIAAAIIAEYPSPQLLLQGYRNCGSTREAEMLLQDIVIRRGEGVLATTRRVGPELSRRVYKQMTSVDGDQLL